MEESLLPSTRASDVALDHPVSPLQQYGTPGSSATANVGGAAVPSAGYPSPGRRYGHVKPQRRASWLHVAAILVAELVGTGVLALPHTLSSLGLIPGVALLLAFSALTLYSGLLLWRIQDMLPHCITYADAARESLGQSGKKVVMVLLYSAFVGNLSIYLITCAETLRGALYDFPHCTYTLTGWTAVFLLPFCQLRSLYNISSVAAASGIAILLALVIILFSVLSQPQVSGNVVLAHYEGFFASMAAATTAIFAFGGQGIFFETMAEMKTPSHFPRSVRSSTVAILVIYLVVAIVCYLRFGDCIQGNILNELTNDWSKRVAALLIFFHVCVSYVLAQQIVCRAIHTRLAPHRVDTGSKHEKAEWFMVSSGVMFSAWLLANLIPFFTHLMGIVGAVTTAPLTFAFPCFMYYVSARRHQVHIPNRELVLMVFLCLLAAYLMTVGFVSNVSELITKWKATAPFSCDLAVKPQPSEVPGANGTDACGALPAF